MTYTANTPQATQIIAATQPLIQGNFSYLDTALKVNHTFNGNGIGVEAAGSHKRLDFPNQGSDIVALPAGIAAVQYCIGGNLYTWNGAKRPVSGVAAVTTLVFPGTFTIVTLPADCTGYLISLSALSVVYQVSFDTISGVGRVALPVGNNGTASPVVINNPSFSFSGLNLQAATASSVTRTFKYIYWPI